MKDKQLKFKLKDIETSVSELTISEQEKIHGGSSESILSPTPPTLPLPTPPNQIVIIPSESNSWPSQIPSKN